MIWSMVTPRRILPAALAETPASGVAASHRLWHSELMPPTPKRQKFWSAAFVCALLAPALLAACTKERQPAAANSSNQVQAPTAVEKEAAALPLAGLDREHLLVAMMQAATRAELGSEDEEAERRLKGRRFELRMRFGCPGTADARRSWTYDQAAGALRVKVVPDELAAISLANEATDAGDSSRPRGFLIANPTRLSAGCPAKAYAAIADTTALRFAIAPLPAASATRAAGLLDSYEIVKKIAADAAPAQGLDLVIRGRLDSAGNEPVVQCAPSGGAVECRSTATIDTISILDPSADRLIAEWGPA
jgi:hypothetical protein